MLGQAVDYGAERAKATCEGAAIHCVYVDVRDVQIQTGWDKVGGLIEAVMDG
jgi:hypothetical protein